MAADYGSRQSFVILLIRLHISTIPYLQLEVYIFTYNNFTTARKFFYEILIK